MSYRRVDGVVGGILGRALGAGVAACAWLAVPAAGLGQSIPLSPTAQASGAAITQQHGIEFVTVGAAGNAPYLGGPPDESAFGRGRVDYQYRIGRFEVTSAQWVEFFNAAYDRPQAEWLPHLIPPDSGSWGGRLTTPNTPGGLRWTTTPATAMVPTGDISWRMAAMYANWLHNDKSTDRGAFLSGAYDVSTFGYFGNIFTDQFERSPGARFFVPTLDEWLKAAHFDPNRFGQGQEGWWEYSITRDTRPLYGPPSIPTAEANAGFDAGAFSIALGAYPTVQSPWGLLDTAGGTMEWQESVLTIQGRHTRFVDGTFRGRFGVAGTFGVGTADLAFAIGDDFPSIALRDYGFRIAASVPSPTTILPLVLAGSVASLRRRRA